MPDPHLTYETLPLNSLEQRRRAVLCVACHARNAEDAMLLLDNLGLLDELAPALVL